MIISASVNDTDFIRVYVNSDGDVVIHSTVIPDMTGGGKYYTNAVVVPVPDISDLIEKLKSFQQEDRR